MLLFASAMVDAFFVRLLSEGGHGQKMTEWAYSLSTIMSPASASDVTR